MAGLEELANRLRASTVQIISQHGGGSGIVWGAKGTIVSNAHVVRGKEATILFPNGEKRPSKVIRRDGQSDLAVLTGVPGLAPAATIGDSSRLRPGQMVIAVGNPLGFTGAVSSGVIHATGGRWVQADVRLAPGNSGGMLANTEGEVVGINTMVYRGLGLAIPSNEAAAFVRNESFRVRLGIEMMPVSGKWMVVGIERDSLAQRAGVQLGDVLLVTPDRLRSLLADLPADIPVQRAGVTRILRVHRSAVERQAA